MPRQYRMMTMKKLSAIFAVLNTLLFLIAGWGGAFVVTKYFQLQAINTFAAFPLLYLLWDYLMIYIVNRNFHKSAAKIVNTYMALKISKLLVSGGVLLYLVFFVIAEQHILLISFGAYYLLQLLLESLFLYQVEIQKKREPDV